MSFILMFKYWTSASLIESWLVSCIIIVLRNKGMQGKLALFIWVLCEDDTLISLESVVHLSKRNVHVADTCPVRVKT